MLKERRDAVHQVADRLFAAEKAIDLALRCAAELNATMPAARSDANLAASVGQDALERAADAFASLVQARRQMVEAHQRLDETKTQIGLRTLAVGGGSEKGALGAGGHLSMVGSVAA